MRSYSLWMFLAAFAAVVAGPGAGVASALDEKDELAEGDWRGEKEWTHLEPGGAAPPPANTGPAPSSGTGTPTPAPGGSAPAPTSGGTATTATGTNESSGTSLTPDEPEDPEPEPEPTPAPSPESGDPTATPPAIPPGTGTPPYATVLQSCGARWVYEVSDANPSLYELQTMLTIVLFRTDAFAFISNGYCRSESTWYIDAFATTRASYERTINYSVELRLEHPCPNCQPKIRLNGIFLVQAKAQVKSPWPSVDVDSMAQSRASITWAGDIHGSTRASADVSDAKPTGQVTVGADPVKVIANTSKGLIHVVADDSTGDGVTVHTSRTKLNFVNQGSVTTCAAGADNNCQAKSRVAYSLDIRGDSACGAWGEYIVTIKD